MLNYSPCFASFHDSNHLFFDSFRFVSGYSLYIFNSGTNRQKLLFAQAYNLQREPLNYRIQSNHNLSNFKESNFVSFFETVENSLRVMQIKNLKGMFNYTFWNPGTLSQFFKTFKFYFLFFTHRVYII